MINVCRMGRSAAETHRLVSFALSLASVVLLGILPVKANALELPLRQVESGGLYLSVAESALNQGLLLDTGSSYSVVTRDAYRELSRAGRLTFARRVLGRMADGSTASVDVYLLDRLVLSSGCKLDQVEVAVVPGSDRNILGLSVLTRLQPFTVSLQPATLSVERCRAGTAHR